jgi:hypothetical protein
MGREDGRRKSVGEDGEGRRYGEKVEVEDARKRENGEKRGQLL